jgi:hemerythrin-like domain-containing protein
MKKVTPIRRARELQPLSRDHHDGLLFVWKIRQGLKIGVDTARIGRYINWYWENHLCRHFLLEENTLVPLMPGDRLLKKMKLEHNDIRNILNKVALEPFPDDIGKLAGMIEQHIRFEERELFQYLREHLSAVELSGLLAKFEEGPEENSCTRTPTSKWYDEFWVNK